MSEMKSLPLKMGGATNSAQIPSVVAEKKQLTFSPLVATMSKIRLYFAYNSAPSGPI